MHVDNQTGGHSSVAGLYYGPKGQTGDVVVTFSYASTIRCGIALVPVRNIKNISPYDTHSSIASAASSGALDVPAGGVVIGYGPFPTVNSSIGVAWTGLTEHLDKHIETFSSTKSHRHSLAAEVFRGAQVGHALSVSGIDSGAELGVLLAASFR